MKKIKFWRGHTVTGTLLQVPSLCEVKFTKRTALCNFQSKTKIERRYEGDVTSESSSRPSALQCD